MVLAMVRNPGEHGPLDGHRAERRQRVADASVRLEGAVREQAVEPDGDPDSCQEVADREDGDVRPADHRVPEQDDGDQEGQEGHDHPSEVRKHVRSAHC